MSETALNGPIGGKWNVLRAGGGSDGLEVPSLPLDVRTAGDPVRLAIGSGGEARLLIPLGRDDHMPIVESGPALSISACILMHKGRALRFLDLTCLSPELETVFAEVVDELLARIAAGSRVSDAVSDTLEDFRALLVPASRRAPERNQVAGLVAELVVLNRLLDISERAWRAWRGPAGDRHDFRTRDTSLEIKASLRAGTKVITINGLEQMEPPTGGNLHLLHMIIEPVAGGLLGISALGNQALAKADDPAGLRKLLHATGCDDIEDPAWNRYTFRLDSEQLYCVDSRFPRISPSVFAEGRVPAGVVDATYQINLDSAESSKAPPERLGMLLQELAS